MWANTLALPSNSFWLGSLFMQNETLKEAAQPLSDGWLCRWLRSFAKSLSNGYEDIRGAVYRYNQLAKNFFVFKLCAGGRLYCVFVSLEKICEDLVFLKVGLIPYWTLSNNSELSWFGIRLTRPDLMHILHIFTYNQKLWGKNSFII